MPTREDVIKNKELIVDDLVSNIKESDALFITNYRGLTVTQIQEFRKSLRESGASYRVIKNTLTLRAFSSLNIECPEGVAKGPTAIVISKKDCSDVASKLVKFKKANDVVEIKGGILDGQFLTKDDVNALSKIPSKDVLIGTFVGTLKSTINRFVMSLSSPMRGLVYSLDSVSRQKNN